jgi:hypothetical protein
MVQPYEDMAYYNPETQAGKMRAFGLSNWAKNRIGNRWQGDMDAIEAQEMAKKYGFDLPGRYKGRGAFKVDFSGGY